MSWKVGDEEMKLIWEVTYFKIRAARWKIWSWVVGDGVKKLGGGKFKACVMGPLDAQAFLECRQVVWGKSGETCRLQTLV